MNTQELELAIDRAQWLVRRLTEARTLRWYGEAKNADAMERHARMSLEDTADLMGFEVVSKERQDAAMGRVEA